MGNGVKTDNALLAPKLALRREALAKIKGPIDVLDCCAGYGVLWSHLRREFKIDRYFACDEQVRPGALKMDSLRLLDSQPIRWNVIDIDTYGYPVAHLLTAARKITKRTTFFLTWGVVGTRGSAMDTVTAACMGINFRVRPGLWQQITGHMLGFVLKEITKICILSDMREAFPQVNARYISLVLEPKGMARRKQAAKAGGSVNGAEHSDSVDGSHVQHRLGMHQSE